MEGILGIEEPLIKKILKVKGFIHVDMNDNFFFTSG